MTTIALDVRKLADFGIGTYVRGLLGGLAEVDPEGRYALIGDPALAGQLPARPRQATWIDERAPGYSLRELWSVPKAVRRAGAALFHAPHYVLPPALPCPAVVTIHDLIHLRFPEHRTFAERLYARWMLRRALRRSARVIAVSETTRRELVDRFGALAGRVVAVPNGVDERFRAPLDRAAVEARLAALGLAPGYLLFVGNPKPHKNLPRLLEAHQRLRERRGAAAPPLVIAGASGTADDAEGVRRLGVVDAEDLPALYRGALALVAPSLWEGFGLPSAEAMACGTPVVAADRGALPEVVGDAGLRVDPLDDGAIAAAIERLLDDPELRRELARRGPERADRFRWRETARATLDVYRQVLGASA